MYNRYELHVVVVKLQLLRYIFRLGKVSRDKKGVLIKLLLLLPLYFVSSTILLNFAMQVKVMRGCAFLS